MENNTNMKTFYHETSLVSANSIVSKQIFHPSQIGKTHNPLFGPGIYFATTINGAHYKANHHGYILSADVIINKPKEMTKPDAQSIKNNINYWQKIRNEGYDSIYGRQMPTGDEVVVFNQNQIRNIRIIKCTDSSSVTPIANWNLENILNSEDRQITLFYVSSSKIQAENIVKTQSIPNKNGIFGNGIYLFYTLDDALIDNPNGSVFISVHANLSNVYKLQQNENVNRIRNKCFYCEVNSIKYFYFKDKNLISSIHICGDLDSKKDMTCQILVTDLPMNRKEENETTSPVESFLNKLFVDYGILHTPDAITIRTKKDHYGIPTSAYAFVKFENNDQASKAVNELNYTKYKGIPIRLILSDENTKKIIDSKIGNVFVKNLDSDTDVAQLHEAFAKYGEIISCEIPSDIVNVGNEKKNVGHGYGYVQFRRLSDSKKAINDSNNIYINGKQIEVEMFNPHPYSNSDETFTNCYIANLPENYTKDDLIKLFSQFGKIKSCIINKSSKSPYLLYGYCNMSNHDEATSAVQNLNRKKIEGKSIICKRAFSKKESEAKEKINQYKKDKIAKEKQDRCKRDSEAKSKTINEKRNRRKKENDNDDEIDKNKSFTNCYIANLPPKYTKDDLANLFSQYGTLKIMYYK